MIYLNQYVSFLFDKACINIDFIRKTHYIDCPVKELGNNNKILHIHQHHFLKRKFFHLLGYLLKMITLTYPLYIGYLSYISVRTKKCILQDLLSAPSSHCRSS